MIGQPLPDLITGSPYSHIADTACKKHIICVQQATIAMCWQGTQGGEAIQFGAARDSQTAADTAQLSGHVSTGAATFAFIQAVERAGTNISYGRLLQVSFARLHSGASILEVTGEAHACWVKLELAGGVNSHVQKPSPSSRLWRAQAAGSAISGSCKLVIVLQAQELSCLCGLVEVRGWFVSRQPHVPAAAEWTGMVHLCARTQWLCMCMTLWVSALRCSVRHPAPSGLYPALVSCAAHDGCAGSTSFGHP